MLRGLRVICLMSGGACCFFSQTADKPLAYEAASVKVNTSGSGSSGTKGSDGQTVFTNVPLKRLIVQAYEIQDFQLVGPQWMGDVRFDITAKYPPGPKYTLAQRNLMTQSLLAERFHLVIHRDTKEMPAYALMAGKNGPKLEKSVKQGNSTNTNNTKFDDEAVSMAGFAKQLAGTLGSPVVDQTGLTGSYRIILEWAPDDKPGSTEASVGPSIFTALQDQLGLKLQKQKLPVEMIVVDSVDRTPVEN